MFGKSVWIKRLKVDRFRRKLSFVTAGNTDQGISPLVDNGVDRHIAVINTESFPEYDLYL